MAREGRTRTGDAGPHERARACCLISEMLEEAGLDREKIRSVRRQVLEGVILLCRWQLERMSPSDPGAAKRGRKVAVE